MKKFLALVVVLLIAAGAFIQFAVPTALTNYLKDRVTYFTKAQEVSLMMDSLPDAKIAFGYVDNLRCTASDATIGELHLKKVHLEGTSLNINIKEIVFPTEGISREDHTDRCLTSAGSLELSGVITAESLSKFLAEKIDRLEDPKVTMTPKGIAVASSVKIINRSTNVQIGGQIVARDGDLFLNIDNVNIENAILRRVNLDKFLNDLNLTKSVKMPFKLKFRTVEMREGEAFVKATRD